MDERNILKFESSEALEKTFRESQARKFQYEEENCQKQFGIDVANNKQYLMVLGSPGAGKSTFLRKMGLEALKGKKRKYKHKCIPVFLELKRFTDREIDIKQLITEEFKICGFPSPEKFTAKALEQGRLLILLDGLDEVPTKNLNTVIDTIQDFVDRYDKNRFIVSCRVAAYHTNFRRFTDLVMAEFDEEQIEQFIGNWFRSAEDRQTNTAQDCWQLLQQPKNEAAKELAQTPLLLTFLCLVYDKSQNFPDNRSVLYRKALRILLEEWASEKRIQRDEIYQGLHTDLEEILLAEISYQGFDQDQLFYDRRNIVEQIKAFLANNLNAPQHLNGEAVLQAIEVQQGILVERLEDVYSFSHLTLQEYLTAQYIVDHNQIQALVDNHLTDRRWKEVFQLVAGLMRNGADELLLSMVAATENYLQTTVGKQKLVPLLNWAEEITTGSQGDLSPIAKRAIAYAYAHAHARAYARAYAYAYALALAVKYLIDYAQELAKLPEVYQGVDFSTLVTQLKSLKANLPQKEEPTEVQKKFARNLIELWLSAFRLAPELIDLSEAELEEIDQQYFYVNWLILQCKQSAVRVLPQTWHDIEEKMLRVRD